MKGRGGARPATPKTKGIAPATPGGRARPPLRPWLVACLAYTAFLAVLLSPLFGGGVEPRWDARDQFYPAFTYVADSLQEGRWPLWDPYTSSGYPFHAEPDHPTLNPLAVALSFATTDTIKGFLLFWTLHWWWAGIGMIWFARHMGAGPAGGLAAAALFSLSGFFVAHAQHTPYICVAAWLPWIFLFADKAVASANFGFALLAGAAMGISALGGYPVLVFFTGFALALWLALRHVAPWGGQESDVPPRPVGTRALRVGVTLAVTAAVALVAWSPVLHAFFTEGAGYTDRVAAIPVERAVGDDVFPLPALFSLVFPYATIAGRPWMGADISMTNGYAGALAFPLAALWFLKGNGNRRPWWLLVFFLFMFLVSLGGKAGLRTVLHYLLPPLRFMRFSAPFRLFWILPLALAAGKGLSMAVAPGADRGHAFRLTAGWAAAALAAGLGLAFFLRSHGAPPGTVSARLFLPAAVVLPLAAVALRFTGNGLRAEWAAALPLLLLVLADTGGHIRGNSETAWVGRDSLKQAEAFHRRTTFASGEPGPRHPPLPFGYFNAQEIVKEHVVQGSVSMKSRGFDEVLCRSRFVDVMTSSTRYWISPGVEPIASREAALSTLAATGAGNPVPAFVDASSAALPPGRAVPGAYGRAAIVAYAPERIEMDVFAPGPAGGFLTGTERFATGWTVRVDGAPQKAICANLYFRGAYVPPGRHSVVWEYAPAGWRPLVVLCFASLALSGAAGAWLAARARPRPAAA